MGKTMRRLGLAAVVLAGLLSLPRTTVAAAPADLESGLNVTIGGVSKTLTLSEAMAALNVPSVSIALIDQDGIAVARLRTRRDARHAFSGCVAVEIRRGDRRDAPRRSAAARPR